MKSKVWQFSALGGPERLELAEQEIGEPGPGEALIELEAIGLNRSDLLFMAGRYLTQPPSPSCLGQEAVGRIAALGPLDGEASSAAGYVPVVGDRVALLAGRVDYAATGTYRTAGIYPVTALLAHPPALDVRQGAALWLTGLTAMGGLGAGGLDGDSAGGKRVLITAASSGVGVLALQIARNWGARTLAATTSEEKVEALAELADDVVVVDPDPAITAERISEVSGGRGFDVAFDPVGYANVSLLFESAADSAQIVYYGLMAGTEAGLELVPLLRKNLGVHGFTIYRLLANPTLLDRAVSYILDMIDGGRLELRIDSVYPFAEAPAALAAMARNEHLGKIVVEV